MVAAAAATRVRAETEMVETEVVSTVEVARVVAVKVAVARVVEVRVEAIVKVETVTGETQGRWDRPWAQYSMGRGWRWAWGRR